MNVLEYTLRREKPADWHEVDTLIREAFGDADVSRAPALHSLDMPACDEHLMVHHLRKSAIWVSELSWVAERRGQLIGSIMYSHAFLRHGLKVDSVPEAGTARKSNDTFRQKDDGLLLLGPHSVLPAFQGMGVGGALIEHTLTEACSLGYRGVLLFGHPGYYSYFGFRPAGSYGIVAGDGGAPDAFMVRELYPESLTGISGQLVEELVFQVGFTGHPDFSRAFPPKKGKTE